MVLYAAVRYFEQFEDRSLKNIGRWLGTFFVYSIIAVLIAAVILLPVILPVLGTDRFKAQNYVPLLYDKVYYEKYLGCLIGENMIQWGVAGFTAVSMTGVFVLFSKRKKYTALKVGFVLLNAFFASALCRTCVKWIFLCLKSMDLGVWDADRVHLCKNISGIVYTDSEGKKKDICYASHILWNCIAS